MFKNFFRRKVETPDFYIGKNKDLYIGNDEQRELIKNNLFKHMIYTDNNWELHAISVGVNHPLFNEVNTILEKYKSENLD